MGLSTSSVVVWRTNKNSPVQHSTPVYQKVIGPGAYLWFSLLTSAFPWQLDFFLPLPHTPSSCSCVRIRPFSLGTAFFALNSRLFPSPFACSPPTLVPTIILFQRDPHSNLSNYPNVLYFLLTHASVPLVARPQRAYQRNIPVMSP